MSLPNIFKALSDPVRREILLKLKQKRKMSAGEIAAEFDLTNATISYHLSTLKKADLIFETRYQKYIYYEINTSVFESVVMWLMQFQEDKDEYLEEAASTRLLIYAALLIKDGMDPVAACRVGIIESLTDDAEVAEALMEVVSATFGR